MPPSAGGAVTRAYLARDTARLGIVQIDSVNVLARAHLMPFYSRLGPYDVAVLDRALTRRPVIGVEYWAHEASFVHPPLVAALKWRMSRAADEAWGSMSAVGTARPELLESIVSLLAQGPATARQLQAVLEPDGHRPSEHWGWNWTDVKRGVEWLFWSGRVSSAGRTAQFERRYCLPEMVWPTTVVTADVPDEADAVAVLVEHAARAMGVATTADLRDYFRLPASAMSQAIQSLVASGALVEVDVDGWNEVAWRHVDAWVPTIRTARATTAGPTALISPFDPLIWHRPRTERLFGFTYRLEIYVPREQRRYGYYVLPFLLRGRLVARVDLRADRAGGVLEVPSAWIEPGAPEDTAQALAAELRRLGGWLGLTEVGSPRRGDLAAELGHAVR